MEETGPVTYHTASPDVYFQAISKIEKMTQMCYMFLYASVFLHGSYIISSCAHYTACYREAYNIVFSSILVKHNNHSLIYVCNHFVFLKNLPNISGAV